MTQIFQIRHICIQTLKYSSERKALKGSQALFQVHWKFWCFLTYGYEFQYRQILYRVHLFIQGLLKYWHLIRNLGQYAGLKIFGSFGEARNLRQNLLLTLVTVPQNNSELGQFISIRSACVTSSGKSLNFRCMLFLTRTLDDQSNPVLIFLRLKRE